jgi:ADP-ribose pyrophosphatase
MSNLEEKYISREEIFDGRILHVVKDTVSLPDGGTSFREICLHTGGVSVLPLLDDGRVIVVRQYRYAHGRVFVEIPAGKLNSLGEDPLEAGKRELREETGAIAKSYTDLGQIATTPALINERIYVYLAEGLSFGESELDEGEFLEVESIPFSELYRMVMRGEVKDAKTQIAVLKTAAVRPHLLD